MTLIFCGVLTSQSKVTKPAQMEVLHIRCFLPWFQFQINHPDSDVCHFQQHWKPYMELAVTPCWPLTHEVQQFTVRQYMRLLLPAVPPAPTPEVTTWEQDRGLAVSALGSCQACTQQNLHHHWFQLTLTHQTGDFGLSPQPPSLRCSS